MHFKPKSGVIFGPFFRNRSGFLYKFKVEIEVFTKWLSYVIPPLWKKTFDFEKVIPCAIQTFSSIMAENYVT